MRLTKIDESNRADHARLLPSDECFYLHEYTSGQGFSFGIANSLISNLKKSIERVGKPEYAHKVRAITKCSTLLRDAISSKWMETGTLVPVPPSKDADHPLYDDRLTQICRGINPSGRLDVRELVVQLATMRASHESIEIRPSVGEIESNYRIDHSLTHPPPVSIAVVDDVLTAGTHYRAMHNILTRNFPGVPIVGVFIARRVFLESGASDEANPF